MSIPICQADLLCYPWRFALKLESICLEGLVGRTQIYQVSYQHCKEFILPHH
jgi:hypothetical protein